MANDYWGNGYWGTGYWASNYWGVGGTTTPTTAPISIIGAKASSLPRLKKRRLHWQLLKKLQAYFELKSSWR